MYSVHHTYTALGYYCSILQCEGPDQYCIATRYRCDSHDDCPGGDDEAPLLCGHEPCKGKITCPELDFRCIDPTEVVTIVL